MQTDELMTIGELSRRTGVSIKVLRRYDEQGLLYSARRRSADYRLFEASHRRGLSGDRGSDLRLTDPTR